MQATYDRLDSLLEAASTPAERYRRVAGGFSDRLEEVPQEAWDRPSPCEGWRTRDVVGHLVEWVPAVIGRAGIDPPEVPDVEVDPVGAWRAVDAWLQAALDDATVAEVRFDAGPPGELTVATAIDLLVTGDVLVHTWDVARSGGLDERIDATIAAQMLGGLEPMDEVLRASGHFGPRVEVPSEADDQTKLLAFTGRRP